FPSLDDRKSPRLLFGPSQQPRPHSVSVDAPTGSGSAAPTPISTSGATSVSSGASAGAWAASARWGDVGSPIAVGQMWNPPLEVGGISQRPQIPFPSLYP